MTTTITPEEIYMGAPASLTYGGVEVGATLDPPKITITPTIYSPPFQNAKGKVKNADVITDCDVACEFTVNQITAAKLAWALPGSTSTTTASVGFPLAGLDTTLAADPALAATNIKVTSVTTVTVGQFVRIAPASPTEANSEVVEVLTVGTTGSGGTGLNVQNDEGGGLRIDHATAETVKTVVGTKLAANAAAGATAVLVDDVTGFTAGDILRVGYLGHYETRTITTVGTSGPTGTGLQFALALARDHALDEWVIDVTALGTTTITWTPGRIPSSAYQDLILTGVGLDGREMIITIYDAISATPMELDFSKTAPSGLKVRMEGRYDGATPNTAPFDIQLT